MTAQKQKCYRIIGRHTRKIIGHCTEAGRSDVRKEEPGATFEECSLSEWDAWNDAQEEVTHALLRGLEGDRPDTDNSLTPFDQAMDFVFAMEGEGSNDPNDPGGLTKWGISQKSNPDIDVASLTKEQAVEIYRKRYWDQCRCSELPPSLAFVVFDEAVNQGASAAIWDLQVSVGAATDGKIGPETLAKARAASPGDAVSKMTVQRLVRYSNLLRSGYFKGWARRAVECMRKADELWS